MGTSKMIALEIGMLVVLIGSIFAAVPIFKYFSATLNSTGAINETPITNPAPSAALLNAAPTPTPHKPIAQLAADADENNPRAAGAIAFFYGVSTEGIASWHDRGFTYAEIIRGYMFARMSGKSPKEIFPMKSSGMSWDKIEQTLCGSQGHYVPTLGDILSGHAKKPKPECYKDEGDRWRAHNNPRVSF